MAKDFTAKILEARANVKTCDDLDLTPLFVPTGFQVPETSQQTMARLMLKAGMISLDDYQNMIGVCYDGDYTRDSEQFRDFEAWEDDFTLSKFAEYEDDIEYDNPTGLASADAGSQDVSAGSALRSEEGLNVTGDKRQTATLDTEANKQSDSIQSSDKGN